MVILISILKTTELSDVAPRVLGASDNKVIGGDDKVDETIKNLSKSKKLKNTKPKILMYTNIGVTEKPILLNSNTKGAFN